ncbi:hypothetical protein BGX30_006232, partial [Mortierella sp. GBA39]
RVRRALMQHAGAHPASAVRRSRAAGPQRQPDQPRRAEQRRDGSRRQLPERAAEQPGNGRMPPHPEQTDEMRGDQPHKTDRAHHADGDRGEQDRRGECGGAGQPDPLAQRLGGLVPHLQQVQLAPEQPCQNEDAGYPRPAVGRSVPIVLVQRTRAPDEQPVRLVLKQQLERAGERGEHQRHDHAGERHPDRRAPACPGQQVRQPCAQAAAEQSRDKR